MASRAALQQAVGLPENVGLSSFSEDGPAAPDNQNGLEDALSGLPPPPQTEMTEQPDGGVTIDVIPQDTKPQPQVHSDNLAEYMEEQDLTNLAEQVLTWFKADKDSRSDWENMLTACMEYLGLKFEDRNFPFPGASGVIDTLMLESVLRNAAQTCAELLPASGPVKTQIIGIPTEETEQKATRTKDFFNYYLLEGLPEWAEQMEQMFFWRAFAGSTFKKVYQDPIRNQPVSPFLTPNQLVVNYFADSELEACPRVSEVQRITFKELRQRQISGFYRDIDLQQPDATESEDQIQQKVDAITGFKPPTSIDESVDVSREYDIIEQHVDLDLKGFEHTDEETGDRTKLPRPFIVTVEKTSRRILAIRRNWRENDPSFQKVVYYVHYKLLAGLGFYGIGLAHILGNPARAATALQRQMTDAETLQMFSGGLRVKGMRMDDNNKMIGPCEFIEVDTGGLPIQQAVMNMPYRGASEVSLALWKEGRQNAQSLANNSDLSVGDGRQDAPVGTTLALLEAANKMLSATIKSAHRSLRKELKLFAALFGQYLPDSPYPFPVPGGQHAIMRQDFSQEIDVIPVSDPNITSYAQRVTRAEALLRMAQQAPPGVYDLRAANKNMLIEMGVDERKIDAILPPPQQAQPLDPLTENQNAMVGKPVAAGMYQDHQAHIQAHSTLSDQVPSLAAHIAEHLALAMRVNVEKLLGIQLPPPGTKLPPEIENKIAVLVAQALQQLKTPQGQEPTPGQIAMSEIQVEAQKVQAQLQDIQARAATEAFKAQKKFLTDEADRRERMYNAEQDRQTRLQGEMFKAQTQRQKPQRTRNETA